MEQINQIKSNQITFIVTSPQHKCLGEWNSYERAPDSAKKQQTIYLWTDSAKKNNRQFTYGQTVQKRQQTIYIWTDSAKKNNKQFTYGQTVQKSCTGAFTVLQTVQKNNNNLHMDSTYLQTIQKTVCKIHVHIVYYKDTLNYQRHIIHRMGTSTLCTLSIHNVVYT